MCVNSNSRQTSSFYFYHTYFVIRYLRFIESRDDLCLKIDVYVFNLFVLNVLFKHRLDYKNYE